MNTRQRAGVKSWVVVGMALAALVAIGLCSGPPASAAPLEKLDSSIHWVPQDAAVYSSTMRLGEIVEKVGQSRAWARLKSLPAVQDALAKLGAAAGSGEQAATIEAIRRNPEVKRALALLGDMLAHEVFVYVGPEAVDGIDLLQEVSAAMNYGPMVLAMAGQESEVGMAPLKLGLKALVERLDLVKVPNVLLGFKVTNRDRAVEAIGKLETALGLLAMFAPEVGQRLKRKTVAGQDYLTLELDGGLVPWDHLRDAIDIDVPKEQIEKLFAKLKKMTLAVAVGVRGNYVLMLVGPSTDLLGRLGPEKSLAGLPVFQPLEKFVDRKLTGIDYVSPAMCACLFDDARGVKILAGAVERAVTQAKLTDSQKARIRKDLRELVQDVERVGYKPGALMSFDFVSDRGIEVYTRQWGERFELDGSKPLELLGHVGGRPILAALGRVKVSPADYDLAVKWVNIALRYVDEYALPQMDSDDRATYRKVMDRLRPLGKRLDQANRTLMLPALADGQIGLVLDAKLRSRQFQRDLPAFDRPMPMLEPAIVLGLSDAEKFRKGLEEYRTLANDLIDAIRELAPDADIPADLKIPEPKHVETSAGRICSFPLPAAWGVDEAIAPSLGISAHVAAMGISQKHVERLLAETAPRLGGVLGDAARPRAAAVVFDWAGLVDAATPWVDLALGSRGGKRKATAIPAAELEAKKEAPKKPRPMSTREQVRVGLTLLKTLRGVTCDSTIQDGVMVTHTLIEIRDLEPPADKKPADKKPADKKPVAKKPAAKQPAEK